MKIAVVGYSGSGKSTLAKALGERYDCQVLHLDRVHWLPGWRERSREEETKLVAAFLDERDSWVVDGNYFALSYERRLREADRIVFMNFNRFSCLRRVFRRFRQHRGKNRESMTEGCAEKIDFEFVRWILWTGRKKKYRNRYREVVKAYPEKTTVIGSQRELTAFMRNL